MKTERFKISIPQPCTEDWNTMTPTEKGKFCSSCQKEVFDFTDKLDSEIAKIMSKNKHGLCGRFRASQLQQVYTYKVIEPDKKNQLKYAAALALSVFTMKNVHAQSNKTTQEIISIDKLDSLIQTESKIDEDTITLTISMIAKSTQKLIPNGKILISSKSKGYIKPNQIDKSGQLKVQLLKTDFPLEFIFTANNFHVDSLIVEDINNNINLYLDKSKEEIIMGGPMVNIAELELKDIYYDFNSDKIRIESERELNKILYFLQENPDAILEIKAFTDTRGSKETNIKLAQQRAEKVKAWFIKRGIKKSRLKVVNYGETHVLNNCIDDIQCTEYEHQRNRRIEFRIKGKDIDIKSIERFDVPVEPCRNCEF